MAYDPGIQAYVERARRALGDMAGLKALTLAQRRVRADRYAALVREPYPESLEVSDTYIVQPGHEIPVRVYRPRAEGPLPTIVYLHGGSFVAGSPQGHDFITTSLACNTGAQVLSVHYRRAPENPIPRPPTTPTRPCAGRSARPNCWGSTRSASPWPATAPAATWPRPAR